MTTTKVQAYAAQTASSALAPFGITRREPGKLDVEIEILYKNIPNREESLSSKLYGNYTQVGMPAKGEVTINLNNDGCCHRYGVQFPGNSARPNNRINKSTKALEYGNQKKWFTGVHQRSG